jgi:hypothetical protein
MARIVDESYIEDLCSWIKGCDENFEIDMSRVLSEVKADLENMPEVVRCKDCKRYFHYGDGVYGCRTFGMMKTHPDGFCSYGERKGNAKE